MTDAQIHGYPVIRASITSYRTTEKDIAWVVAEMNALLSSTTGRDKVLQAH